MNYITDEELDDLVELLEKLELTAVLKWQKVYAYIPPNTKILLESHARDMRSILTGPSMHERI